MPFRKGLCKAGMLILSNIGVGFRTGTADYTVPKPGSNIPPPVLCCGAAAIISSPTSCWPGWEKRSNRNIGNALLEKVVRSWTWRHVPGSRGRMITCSKLAKIKNYLKVILMLFERVHFIYLSKFIYKGRLISCCCFLKVMEVSKLETSIGPPRFE